MNKRLLFCVLYLLAVISAGCNKSDEESTIYGKSWEEKWIVASKTITATGSSGPEICYWIKVDNNPVWQISHSQIGASIMNVATSMNCLLKLKKYWSRLRMHLPVNIHFSLLCQKS